MSHLLIEETIHRAAELWANELLRGDKERFQFALETEMKAAIGQDMELIVRTDYDPDETLWKALEAAGIESSSPIGINTCRETLPYKSVMKIRPGMIEVRWGRGAAWECIEVGASKRAADANPVCQYCRGRGTCYDIMNKRRILCICCQ